MMKTKEAYPERLYIIVSGIVDITILKRIISLLPDLKYNVKYINGKNDNEMPKAYRILRKTYNYSMVALIHDLDDNRKLDDIKKLYEIRKETQHYFLNLNIELLMILCARIGAPSAIRKRDYSREIEKLYHLNNYEGTEEDAIKIAQQIDEKSLVMLTENLNGIISEDETCNPSTDIVHLIELLTNTDAKELVKKIKTFC